MILSMYDAIAASSSVARLSFGPRVADVKQYEYMAPNATFLSSLSTSAPVIGYPFSVARFRKQEVSSDCHRGSGVPSPSQETSDRRSKRRRTRARTV
jgi:hypothetical protein